MVEEIRPGRSSNTLQEITKLFLEIIYITVVKMSNIARRVGSLRLVADEDPPRYRSMLITRTARKIQEIH